MQRVSSQVPAPGWLARSLQVSAQTLQSLEGFLHLRSRKQDKFHAKSYWSVSPWQERKAQPKSSRLSGWNIGIQADLFGVSLAASSEPAITHWVTSLTPFITACALKNKESSLLINSIFFFCRGRLAVNFAALKNKHSHLCKELGSQTETRS